MSLTGEISLFQQTCKRVNEAVFSSPVILCNEEHRFIVAEQMRELDLKAKIILEPVARNTAPAILVSALNALQDNEDSLLLVLPSDHLIGNSADFIHSVYNGIKPAQSGRIITFGIKPDSPHTGYGYMEVAGASGHAHDVVRFLEKPDAESARRYLEAGNYFWNAGIFLFSARTMVNAFEQYAPSMVEPCRKSLDNGRTDLDFFRLDQAPYRDLDNISVDYAIMEKAGNISCVPLTTSWSDLGSWSAVADNTAVDEADNGHQGDVLFFNSRHCYGNSPDGVTLAIIGLEDVLAIATKDAILVTSRSASEDVKQAVETIKARNDGSTTYHRRVYRPWGWYEGLEQGTRFQVKCLMVKPGEQLSLQSHHHRAEHWVVVSGTARVTVDESVKLLSENQSTYIPVGATHRLENPGKIPALLIEVQSGSYLGEDDIVRYEDKYDRQVNES